MELMNEGKRPANLRTALILLSIALVFIGIMLKTWLFGNA